VGRGNSERDVTEQQKKVWGEGIVREMWQNSRRKCGERE